MWAFRPAARAGRAPAHAGLRPSTFDLLFSIDDAGFVDDDDDGGDDDDDGDDDGDGDGDGDDDDDCVITKS